MLPFNIFGTEPTPEVNNNNTVKKLADKIQGLGEDAKTDAGKYAKEARKEVDRDAEESKKEMDKDAEEDEERNR